MRFSEDDQPLVTDLGLAKRIQSESDLTGTGAIVGTPAYMPPEQASASKEVTTSADVYAIGAILYEGLVGTPPHQGDSAVETLMLAAKGDIPLPSDIDRKVDRTLQRICMKCLSLNPADRYESAGLLAKDLKAWHAGERVSVRPRSFASSFSDVLASQFRSALGAMFLGLLGGLALGIPCYSALAADCVDSSLDSVEITGLGGLFPAQVGEAWWLYPPTWLYRPATFLFAIAFVLLLGLMIQKLVRPEDTRQAISLGLVAGLLMTLVQFTFFSIGAGFNGFHTGNTESIQRLAVASVGPEASRKVAVRKLYKTFPDVKPVPVEEKGEMLYRMVSLQFILQMPIVLSLCLFVCISIATISCVVGTLHAQRVSSQSFGIANQFLRYSEVMILFAMIGVLMILMTVYVTGITNIKTPSTYPAIDLLVAIVAILLAALPGLFLARWYFRGLAYVTIVAFFWACFALT